MTVGKACNDGAKRPNFSSPRPYRSTVSHHWAHNNSDTIVASNPEMVVDFCFRDGSWLLSPKGASGAVALAARFNKSKKPRIFLWPTPGVAIKSSNGCDK